MKVAWFSPHFADGGVERTILLLAKQFAQHGHEVHLVSLKIDSRMLEDIDFNLKVINLGSRRTLFSARALARYLNQEKPDAVISAQHYANVIAVIGRKISRTETRLVLTERVATYQTLGRYGMIERFILGQLMKRTFGSADSVLANSADGAAQLTRFLGWQKNPVRHIYNPTDIEGIRSGAKTSNTHPWFLESAPPVIVAAGRLSEQKDFETLLTAFALVSATRDCRLIILGEGPERTKLETLVSNLDLQSKVSIPGNDSNPFSYFARSAVFVLSSLFEGMPNALIEAIACGTPVVSTSCETGPRELLLDGQAGELVPLGDPKTMADAILRVLDNPEDAKKKAQIGTDNLHRFDPETSYENYLQELAK